MGRVLEGNTVGTSGGGSGAVGTPTFAMKAGGQIAQSDLLSLGYDGLVWPAKVSDYAAVTGPASLASYTVAGNAADNYLRNSAARSSDGSIFIAAPTTSGSAPINLRLHKYSPRGTESLPFVVVDGTNVAPRNVQVMRLSNDNIAVVYYMPGRGYRFAIYDQNLTAVASSTLIENSRGQTGQGTGAIALRDGGFAVCYAQAANEALQRFAIVSNSGTFVVSPTTFQTLSGSAGETTTALTQLSDGNLAIVVSSSFSASQGLFYSIWDTAGLQVLAPTILDPIGGRFWNEICAGLGSFAIAYTTSNGTKAWIFNNGGVQQGGTFTAGAGTALWEYPTIKLVSDDANFYLFYDLGGSGKNIAKLPVSGTGYRSLLALATMNLSIDASCERGVIAFVYSDIAADTPPSYATMRASNLGTVINGGIWPGASLPEPGGSAKFVGVIPATDFVFIGVAAYVPSGTSGTSFFVAVKHTASVVLGVAQSSSPANAIVDVASGPGAFAINRLNGSSPLPLTQLTGSPPGENGTLYTNAVILKGLLKEPS